MPVKFNKSGEAGLANSKRGRDLKEEAGAPSSQTVTYGYNPPRGLLETTSYSSGTGITRVYDALGRLQSITTTPPSSPAISYAYTYNNVHQRTRVTREEGSYWSYGYNDRGELISGKKYWVDNSPVAGMQFEYGFDNLGNRNSAKSGGNNQGTGLRESLYTANSLNQYIQRTVPGAVDVVGTANAAATVTVNNQATERKGEYFHKALALDNTTVPVHSQVDVVGVKNQAGPSGEDAVVLKSGNVYLPKTPELFTHDADGNLTADGRWIYTWDAENRLTAMEAITTVPAAAKLKLEFAYDYQGRRIQKRVYGWNAGSSSYQLQSTIKFVYDGWNLVTELDGANVLLRSYVWGQDLSGTLQGAGGIGGLLAIGDSGESYVPGYDANGNVIALVQASSGVVAASYEYSPFGETLVETGDYAAQNAFRFSSKYSDNETGALYYGYRSYHPFSGRWFGRDPLEEDGGINLYGFVRNGPVDFFDLLGLTDPATPFQVFWEWLSGRGPRTHNCTKGDPFLEDLRQHEGIHSAIQDARARIEKNCKDCNTNKESGTISHSLAGSSGIWKYLRDYSVILTGGTLGGNSAATFLGSYNGSWTAEDVECCEGTRTLIMDVVNKSGARSGTRFPVLGYEKGRLSLVELLQQGRLGIPGGILPDNPFGPDGPMSTVTQNFDWEERIKFEKNPKCNR